MLIKKGKRRAQKRGGGRKKGFDSRVRSEKTRIRIGCYTTKNARSTTCVYTYTHIRTGQGQILLEVKHRILEVDVEPIAPHALRGIKHALFGRLASLAHGSASRVASRTLASSARRRIAPALIEEPVYPKPSLLADDISVIRGRHEADRLGRARVEIARGVHALLNRVGRQLALVVDH